MTISVAKAIENNSYSFNESFVPSSHILDGRLAEFVGDGAVSGSFVVNNSLVTIDAIVTVNIRFQCDNCLVTADKTFNAPFNALYAREGSTVDCDYTYANYEVEILDAVNECILLDMPARMLCKDDCKGLCPICGIDLNTNNCGCYAAQEKELSDITSPFSKLKEYNIFSGGASNGITKA